MENGFASLCSYFLAVLCLCLVACGERHLLRKCSLNDEEASARSPTKAETGKSTGQCSVQREHPAMISILIGAGGWKRHAAAEPSASAPLSMYSLFWVGSRVHWPRLCDLETWMSMNAWSEASISDGRWALDVVKDWWSFLEGLGSACPVTILLRRLRVAGASRDFEN
ncbi:hypothetical protein IWX47DRAFT_842220 [Phyllosticta citricarpa]|uniref:Uncharacterized protein n=1 Tax=Phyllosticta citricarpa TaxID=55181 RepID=A0ABR1LXN7_9PEZI